MLYINAFRSLNVAANRSTSYFACHGSIFPHQVIRGGDRFIHFLWYPTSLLLIAITFCCKDDLHPEFKFYDLDFLQVYWTKHFIIYDLDFLQVYWRKIFQFDVQ